MKKHLMLIDDDSDELEILCNALSSAGITHKCTWAQSVPQALSILEYLVPDVIIIDQNMPGPSGTEGIRMIRELEKMRDVPIILYSHTISNESRKAALNAGATTCIVKPSRMQDLTNQMRKLFAPSVLQPRKPRVTTDQ